MGDETDWPDEESQHWHHLHRRRMDSNANPVQGAQRLAWNDWYAQFNNTLYDHDMDDTDAELWKYMTQME